VSGEAPGRPVYERVQRSEPALPAMSLNMAPMIDVVFLLLTYFILAAQFKTVEQTTPAPAPVRLGAQHRPAADPFELPRRPLVLTVRSYGDGDGEFTINSDDPGLGLDGELTRVAGRIEGALSAGRIAPDQALIVRPATSARWEHAVATFQMAREAGLSRVRFAPPQAVTEGGNGS